MKKLLILFALALLSCSKENITPLSATSIQESIATMSGGQSNHLTSVNVSLLKSVNEARIKHLSSISYEIEPYLDKVVINGEMTCIDLPETIDCNTSVDMVGLEPGIYRFLIKSDNGLLGSDIFEKDANSQALEITIDNESTGNYLISIITQQTGFREDEIYQRVAHILAYNSAKEYNLEPTVYDLFMSYHGDKDTAGAIHKLVQIITDNKPIETKIHSKTSSVLEPAV